MRAALAPALLVMPLAAAPPAEARKASPFSASPPASTTVSVSRADLDLTRPHDAAILLARVEKVARS